MVFRASLQGLFAVDEARHFGCQNFLGFAFVRLCFNFFSQGIIFLFARKVKYFKYLMTSRSSWFTQNWY